MNPLPIPLNLAIKNRIFILRQHLALSRHLHLPPLHLLHALSFPRKRIIERSDDGIYISEARPLTVLLVSREPPWYLPADIVSTFGAMRLGVADGKGRVVGGGEGRGSGLWRM